MPFVCVVLGVSHTSAVHVAAVFVRTWKVCIKYVAAAAYLFLPKKKTCIPAT